MTDPFAAVPVHDPNGLLGHLLDDINDVVVISDDIGRMVYVSPSLEQVLGFKPEEWIGQDGWPFVHPDDVPAVREQIVAALQSGQDVYRFTVAFRVLDAAGRWRNFEGKGTLRRQGDRLSSMSVLRDVTETVVEQERLQQHLDQLREGTAWFESLVQHISDVIALLDQDATLQYVSPSVQEVLGWSPAALTGRNALDYVHPDDQGAVIEAIDAGNRDPDARRVPIAFRLRHADGAWHDVESLSTVLERDGERVVRVLTVRDVTDRRRAEAERRADEQRLRALAEVAPVAIALTDPGGAIEFANSRWRELFLRDEPDLVGWDAAIRAMEAIHPDDRDDMAAVWAGAVEAGGAAHGFRVGHGEDARWVRGRMVGLTSDRGELAGHVLAIEDVTDLVLAGDELQANRDRLHTLAEVAPIAIMLSGPDGAVEFANDRWRQLFGIDDTVPPEQYPERVVAAVHPEDNEQAWAAWEEGGRQLTQPHEFRVVVHGATRWVRGRTSPLRSPSGEFAGRVSSIEDVTDLVVAGQALQANQDQLRTIMAMAPIGIVQMDIDGSIVFANERWRAFFGVDDDVPVARYGEIASETILPDDREAVFQHWAESAGRGGHAEIQYRANIGGETRWMRARSAPLVDPTGRCIGHVGSVEDITDIVSATQELQINEQRLRALAELAPIGIFQTDPFGIVQFANDRWRDFYGIEHDTEPGYDYTLAAASAVHPDDLQMVDTSWVESAMLGEPMALQYRVLRRGETGWLRVRTAPLRSASGELTGHVGSVEDVTDLVVANEEMRASQEEAARANEAKSQFLSRMSHELRTPLNSIIGFGQLLSLRGFEGDDAEAVELILRGGRHLLDLINEVLDISRIEAGSLGLATEAVDVGSVVREALAALRPQASAREVTLHGIDDAVDGLTVKADRQRFLQVLLNLVSNAVKYNRAGGSVTVDAARQADGTVAIAVHDTGRGIAPELLDRLFQPFDRLGAESLGIEGAGIGLTLSKALVDEMGGSLDAESVDGVGTTFTVKLPAAG